MAKKKIVYTCQECGAEMPKWQGRCPQCQAWNSLVEETVSEKPAVSARRADFQWGGGAQPLVNLKLSPKIRLKSGFQELDRVLGGGVLPGEVVLLAGEPGIGKSTLMLQYAHQVAAKKAGSVLYVSGEESPEQLRLRAERLGCLSPGILTLSESFLEGVIEEVKKLKPALLIVDSIQAMYSGELEAIPGSVAQVRECAGRLHALSKQSGIRTFFIGHVTKSGAVAGPRVVEHLVDCVLFFEGSGEYDYRLLRAIKNRFGSTEEVGLFEMAVEGLKEVNNPSELFLPRRRQPVAGSVVAVALEGNRALLVEIQALVSKAAPGSFVHRQSSGIDARRLGIILAVIEKRLGLRLYSCDVYVNVAGGLRIPEPGADLAVALAIVSSHKNLLPPAGLVAFGELALNGEVRPVRLMDTRIKEAARLGSQLCLAPHDERLKKLRQPDMNLITVTSLISAMEVLGR